jgi:beta-N-acetylhexosaminidase
MALGPLMLDVDGLSLSSEDCELLKHPTVGGVILFSRNYQSVTRLQNLCAQIHELREPRLLIAVDQEGGRVQRFREEFCKLPPAQNYGYLYDADSEAALNLVSEAGWLVASELRACGLDLNFAPILDLKLGRSQVIGGRAFHSQADAVTRLARAFNRGMAEAGMQAVGKHFPGHGWVTEDSHSELPLDTRSLADMELQDLVPFERLARDGMAGIMTGHLRVPSVDDRAVSFSKRWLSEILRGQLNFQGAIFSDDLSMHGAHAAGDPVERASIALSAGCDMVLFCNNREGAAHIVSKLTYDTNPMRSARLARLHGQGDCEWEQLQLDQRYVMLKAKLEAMDMNPELDLQNDSPA